MEYSATCNKISQACYFADQIHLDKLQHNRRRNSCRNSGATENICCQRNQFPVFRDCVTVVEKSNPIIH